MSHGALSHGLWRDTAPEPPAGTVFQGEARTDVAVIGGGYTGLSAALHLAGAGVDVVLLEAREIGYGGAGRNVGLVNAGLWLMPDVVEQRLGSVHGPRLLEILGRSPDLVFGLIEQHGIACEAVRRGTLHCAHAPAGYRALQQREAQWRRRGARVTLLDRAEASSRIGSRRFHGALLDERAGTLQPLAYTYGLANAGRHAGAALYSGSPVIQYRRTSGGWRLTTPEGLLTARFVIVAVQGYPVHAFKGHARAMIPFNYFQFATAPLPQQIRDTILPGGQGAWDTHLILSSFRKDAVGRLIVGSVGQVEQMGYRLHAQWSRRAIRAVFPQVGDPRLAHAWNGRIAMTPDHIPRLHILDRDMVTVTSYNGRGIGPGTMFGKLLARFAISGSPEEIPLPVTAQKPVFFRRLRGLAYEDGARAHHLIKWRSGR